MKKGIGINPGWNPYNSSATFSSKEMNQIVSEMYFDEMDFWQSQFGLFGQMTLNEDRNFVVRTLKANPLLVQPHKSCGWDPLGGLTHSRREYMPCKTKINTQQCYDEFFDSCFKHFLKWNGTGPVQFNQEGQKAMNLLMNVLLTSAIQGVRLTATLGKFFDYDKVKEDFQDGVPTSVQKLFQKTIADPEICAGYLYIISKLEEKAANIDFSKVVTFGEDCIEGSIKDVIALMKKNFTSDMSQIYRSKGTRYFDSEGRSRVSTPIFLATPDWMEFIENEYEKQNNDAAVLLNQKKTIKTKNFNWKGLEKEVYFVNGVPVAPIYDQLYATKYLKGDVSAFVLTTTGNINIGGSFGNLPNLESRNLGLRVQMHTNNQNYGQYSVLAHMLNMVVINNRDLVVGQVKYRTAEAAK